MNFYLFIEVKKVGGALVHVYVLEHIVSLFERIQGGAKIGPGGGGGVPFSKELLLQTGRLQQQKECIAVI